jgi:aryl-alcohol dehydrogenase-like predicted oxidoreductase
LRIPVPKFQGGNFYRNRAIVDEIKKLAIRKGCSVAQIALAWVTAQGLITIPGTTKASRLEENWASRDIELTEEELKEMRKIVDAAKPVGARFDAVSQSLVGH